MWPKRHKNELISFIFYPEALVCAWIQASHKNKYAPLQMRAFTCFPLANTTLQSSILFNSTILKKLITTFLKTYKQNDASISFCLTDPMITQHYVTLPTTNSTKTTLARNIPPTTLQKHHLMYQYDENSTFYTYTISRPLILQFQLLAIRTQLDLIRITTTESALFYIYKHIHDAAFRQTQLALDMVKHNNKLEQTITVDMMRRIIQIPSGHITQQELIPLATSCGLFLLDKEQL